MRGGNWRFDDSPVYSDVIFLFWLSIGLWALCLVSYALILSGDEHLERKEVGTSESIPFEARPPGAAYPRSLTCLYRIVFLSAIGAMLTGGFFLLTGNS